MSPVRPEQSPGRNVPKPTGSPLLAAKPGPSTRPSSLGARPVSAKCASTTVPSLISASAAAVECGRRCGHARTVPSFYLPDPDGLHGEQQSPAMDVFQERLREDGLETNWQPTYNAGANPVSIRLRQ